MNILRKRWVRILLVVCGVAGLVVALRVWYLEEQGNFHAITPGEAYRSAQMDRDELEYYLEAYHIRSIINLRGERAGEPWYDEEIETCASYGVTHYDLDLSSSRAPTPEELQQLLDLFCAAPRPVLIHCHAGADRSGLAAALWKMVVDGESEEIAEEQLSLYYGHLPVGPTEELDDFLETWDRGAMASCAE